LAARAEFGWPPLYALTDDRYSFILHKNPELYRMDIDPGQNHDLAAGEKEEALRRSQRIMDFLSGASPLCIPAEAPLAEEQRDLIAGLGYIGGGRGGAPEPEAFSPEVDFKAQAGFVDEAIRLRSILNFDGSPERVREAAKGFQKLVSRHPAMPFALRGLGDAHAALGEYGRAEEAYRRLVALAPSEWEPRRSLANFYDRLGWSAKAVAELRALVRLSPSEERVWTMLGSNLAKAGDRRGAEEAYRKALELNPGHEPALRGLEALSGAKAGPRG
jgi:tetratricopeptide (TPR) repeat protein